VALRAAQVCIQQSVHLKLRLTSVTAKHGGYSVGFQFCAFDNSPSAQAIEIPLNPLVLQIAQGADF